MSFTRSNSASRESSIRFGFHAPSGQGETAIDFTLGRKTQAQMPKAAPTPRNYEVALGDLMSSYGMSNISRLTAARR